MYKTIRWSDEIYLFFTDFLPERNRKNLLRRNENEISMNTIQMTGKIDSVWTFIIVVGKKYFWRISVKWESPLTPTDRHLPREMIDEGDWGKNGYVISANTKQTLNTPKGAYGMSGIPEMCKITYLQHKASSVVKCGYIGCRTCHMNSWL